MYKTSDGTRKTIEVVNDFYVAGRNTQILDLTKEMYPLNNHKPVVIPQYKSVKIQNKSHTCYFWEVYTLHSGVRRYATM